MRYGFREVAPNLTPEAAEYPRMDFGHTCKGSVETPRMDEFNQIHPVGNVMSTERALGVCYEMAQKGHGLSAP